jgi:hypothetical protein
MLEEMHRRRVSMLLVELVPRWLLKRYCDVMIMIAGLLVRVYIKISRSALLSNFHSLPHILPI